MIPVAEYTPSSVGDMLANYARIRARFRPSAPVVRIPLTVDRDPTLADPLEQPRSKRARPEYTTPLTEKAKVKRIIRESAERHGVLYREVIGPCRFAEYTAARMEACWRAASETEVSLSEIARLIRKDHTTVIHAVRVLNDRNGTNVRGLGGISESRRKMNLFHARRAAGLDTARA